MDIFGIVAPLFIWIACLVLFLLTFVAGVKLFFNSQRIIKSLNKITKEIKSIEPQNRPIDGEGLEELRSLMESNSFLSDAWEEFDETLISYKQDNEVQIFNTVQAEEYFSDKSLIGSHINLRFYAFLPGILTSLGLLLTFIAILTGLSHIQADPAAQGRLTGVEGLVTSLSGKFLSSIAALILSVCFSFFEKRREYLLHSAVRKLVKTLNKKFARKPAEHILQIIQRDISQQSIAFRQFGTDLSGHLKESFSEGMGPHFQKVAEAVEELRKHKSESLSDSLGQVISQFKDALMGSTNSEFKVLESTLAKTTEVMNAMNEQSKETQVKMNEVIQSLDATVGKQSATGQEHLARLANTMDDVIKKLQLTSTETSSSLTTSVTTLLQEIHSSFSGQSRENAERNEEVSKLMKGMLEQVQHSLNNSTTSVSDTVNGVLEKSAEWNRANADQLSIVLQGQTQNVSSIIDARNSLDNALQTFKEAVKSGATTLNNMGDTSLIVKDGVTVLNSAIINLNNSQDKVSALSSLVERNAENLKAVIDRQGDIVHKYEQTVSALDGSLSNILSQVTSSIENYSSKVKSSLENTLGQFDNHLSNATNQLGSTVQDLNDSLEEIIAFRAKPQDEEQ